MMLPAQGRGRHLKTLDSILYPFSLEWACSCECDSRGRRATKSPCGYRCSARYEAQNSRQLARAFYGKLIENGHAEKGLVLRRRPKRR